MVEKSPVRTHPSLRNRPRSGWLLSNFVMNQIFLETRRFRLSDGEEIMTLAFFVLIQYQSVTDRWTDIPRLAIPAVCIACYANTLVKLMSMLCLTGAAETRWCKHAAVPGRRVRSPRQILRRSSYLQEDWTAVTCHDHVHRSPHVRSRKGIIYIRWFLISAPSLGVYYCQQLTLSVCSSVRMSVWMAGCLSVCHTPSNCFFFFVSRWNRAIFWPSVLHVPLYKSCSSIFNLGPLTPKIYSPKFAQNRL